MPAPTAKLKQHRSRDRRDRIVAAATWLFGRHGIAHASLTDVARRAGVPLPSLYDYFKDKQDLAAAVSEAHYHALYRQLADDAVDDAVPASEDPREKLRAIYLGNLAYISANPDWGRVFFLEIWPSAAVGQARIRKAVDRYALGYIELIGRAIAAGAYRRTLDPYLAMSLLMGGMCQLTAVWLLYRRPYDLVAKGREAFDLLEASFLPVAAAKAARLTGSSGKSRPVGRL